MISSPVTEPFADWLDVTFPPGSDLPDQVQLLFDGLLCPVASDDGKGRIFIDTGGGKAVIHRTQDYCRVSLSGGVLRFLRGCGRLHEMLGVMASGPHKVTRLDAACDYAVDTPPVIEWLSSRFPDDRVCFQRKAIRITRLLSRRDDGCLTGTWYAGHRSSARVTARVYDKQHEALERRGEVLPPLTRVEFTFRKDHGCTLRDVAMPASLYYQFASPKLVERPHGVPDWYPHGEGWESRPKAPKLPYELFKRRVESSPELERLAELAAQFGPEGQALLIRTFTNCLRGKGEREAG